MLTLHRLGKTHAVQFKLCIQCELIHFAARLRSEQDDYELLSWYRFPLGCSGSIARHSQALRERVVRQPQQPTLHRGGGMRHPNPSSARPERLMLAEMLQDWHVSVNRVFTLRLEKQQTVGGPSPWRDSRLATRSKAKCKGVRASKHEARVAEQQGDRKQASCI